MNDNDLLVDVERDLEDLVPLFMQTREADLLAITAALEADDFVVLRRIGHSIKGAGGAYGFTAVARIGGVIEDAALASDAGTVRAQQALLRDHLSRVQVRFVD